MDATTNPPNEPRSEQSRATRRSAAKAPAGKRAKAERKESRAEQIVHELFRLAKVDLRSSQHGQSLAKELGDLIGGK